MGLLDTLRGRPRRARPVGTTLERGPADDGRRARRRNVLVKGGLFLVLTVLTVAAFPRGEVFRYTVEVGDVWQQETLEAPFDFALYKTPEELARERDEIRFNTPPIFYEVPDAQERMMANRDTLEAQLDDIFDAYRAYRINRSRGRLAEAEDDSLRYVELRRNAQVKFTNEQWQRLAEDYVARDPDLQSASRQAPGGPLLYERLLQDAWEFSTTYITRGVLDIPLDSVGTDEIIVRDEQAHTEFTLPKADIYGLNEVYIGVQAFFDNPRDPMVVNMLSALVVGLFVPSLEYQRGRTMQEWQRAESRISPTRGRIARGDVIVGDGDRITEDVRRRLISLEMAQFERSGARIYWRRTLGQLLLAIATFAIFFLYLFMVRRSIFDDNRHVLLMSMLFAGIIGLFALAIRLPEVGMYAVPVAIVSVLLTVIFDSRVGLFATLVLALIGGMLLGYDFEFTFATLFGGTLGVFSVRDIKNRGQFFLSAVLVFLGYAVVMVATWLFLEREVNALFKDLLLVLINAFLVVLAYGLLWLFERTFDVTTDLTLLELSDTNRPLLKELSLRAPGTFNHSLQVANLAEAAAAAVGANALLTRVGALYHDIGKMLKPEYFVENQRPGLNPHDQLKPRMSALIIASHVKEGLEMGRQYKLPQRVLDFIPMHHGTTRIEYFYRKALEGHDETDPPLLESEFRYPGPRPNTKETGILMLSDGVEAASRSLSDPTHKRLESLIDMIIKARIDDGQLDGTALTFRDLKQIKETFLQLLLGIYHIRVKYPGQEPETPAETPPATPPVEAPDRVQEPPASAEVAATKSVRRAENTPEAANVRPADEPAPGGDGQALEGESTPDAG